ncbi:MAG: zf-TFIIB domain-containing protein [Pirellulales bacterium]|nr:zf-TFIIB domain-containing protein [Pirellulales bacterium]
MLCPVCRKPLIIVEYENVELDACPDCCGIWFDAQELQQLFEIAGIPRQYHDLEAHLDRLPRAGPRRICSRCRSKLIPVRAPSHPGNLILDECPNGHGLWFDKGELETLLKNLLGEQSEPLDNVRAYLGKFASPASQEEGKG